MCKVPSGQPCIIDLECLKRNKVEETGWFGKDVEWDSRVGRQHRGKIQRED